VKIVNKNEGTKIPYEVMGNKICFDDDLTINLAKREENDAVHIDVCFDADRNLVIGAAAGRLYVAEIDIPAREWVEAELEEENAENTENVGIAMKSFSREPVPFDISKVTLSLWAIDQAAEGKENTDEQ
jgi:hypothetical protein